MAYLLLKPTIDTCGFYNQWALIFKSKSSAEAKFGDPESQPANELVWDAYKIDPLAPLDAE